MPTKFVKYLVIAFLVLILGAGLVARIYSFGNLGFEFDTVVTQNEWASQSIRMGFFGFWRDYTGFLDYLPGAIIFGTIVKAMALLFTDSAAGFVLTLKIFNSVVDLILVLHVIEWAIKSLKRNRYLAVFVGGLLWLLPATWVVSAYWGQFDNMIVLLLFISFVNLSSDFKFGWQKLKIFNRISNPVWAGIIFALAVSIKPQPILFLPVYAVYFFKREHWSKLISFLSSLLISLVVFNIVPVIANPVRTWEIFLSVFTRNGEISRGASTFWTLLPYLKTPHDILFNLGSYQVSLSLAAQVIFGLISGIVGLYLLFRSKFDLKAFFNLAAVENMAYFLFMMGIHSRYAQFALVFALVPFFYLKNKVLAGGYLAVYILFNLFYAYNQFSVFYYWYRQTVGFNFDAYIYNSPLSTISVYVFLLMLISLIVSAVVIKKSPTA